MPTDPTKLIDHAATKDDRWLMLAIIMVLGAVAYFGLRYFVTLFNNLIVDHKASNKQNTEALETICAEQNKTAKELAVVLDRNARASEAAAAALESCTEELRRCRERRDK